MKSEQQTESTREGDETRYTVGELAELGGVNRRTVRYYVQRGLIPGPMGGGRGSYYTQAHLDRLVRVRELQEQGVALAEVPARLDGAEGPDRADPGAPAGPARPETWTRVTLSPGLELHMRGRVLDSERLHALAAFCHALFDRSNRPRHHRREETQE